MSEVDLEQAAAGAVEAALAAGASDAEAWAEHGVEREIRVYEGSVESLTDAASHGIGIRSFNDGRWGYAYGTDLSDDGLRSLAEAAAGAAAVADSDEHAGLPDEFGAADVASLASPALAEWDTARKIELALQIERVARSHDGVSQVEETMYADASGRVALANSRGFNAAYESTIAYAWASAFAGEGSDLMTGLGVGMGRDPAAIDPEAVGAEAAGRAVSLVGARQPEGRRCPVVLDTFVAASFAGFIGGMLSADAVQRGRSLFADREGDEVAGTGFVLADDGTDPDGPSTAPFDGEGAVRRSTPLIKDGRLLTFLFDARTARKGGRETTGNAGRGSYRVPPSVSTTNLVLAAGEATLEELVARAGNGLYVTSVAGLHSGVNPVSGTFSVGATGRLIENGELGRPVREITIASDLVSM
ncbi:MAG TPA: TldD/PmbA family protein, partial [Thermoleophilaceae bacterium]|nr:TldD/PmbA family protein [Thermoleophilaceae bacterium]